MPPPTSSSFFAAKALRTEDSGVGAEASSDATRATISAGGVRLSRYPSTPASNAPISLSGTSEAVIMMHGV